MLSAENFPNENLGYEVLVLKYDLNGGVSEYTEYYSIDDVSAGILYGNGGRVFVWNHIVERYSSVSKDIEYLSAYSTPILCIQGKSSYTNAKLDQYVELKFNAYDLLVNNIKIATLETINKISLKMSYLDFSYGADQYIRFYITDEWQFDTLYEIIQFVDVNCEMNDIDKIIINIQ
ncbi:hypothetical protein [Paenibacillus sp. FSL H7-0331]|uniref:hypothetical protein n=1 Tax=Paenibacillus sp. FSL H7-0331 TaxID=1920421 RepID=UPI00096C75EA|nr:hypothetical protein [Paenibacillus sp. FSL H7-0331]OME97901.1 hypothetical protein BK127_39985 [Paenibacillus sp. FSL H7-0331]